MARPARDGRLFGPWPIALALGLLLGVGCTSTPVTVHRVQPPRPWELKQLLPQNDELSALTKSVLHRRQLWKTLQLQPDKILESLQASVARSPDPEGVFALAELAQRQGDRFRRLSRPNKALERYLESVAYAHSFLFFRAPVAEPLTAEACADPLVPEAFALYNRSLLQALRIMEKGNTLRLTSSPKVEIGDSVVTLPVDRHLTSWDPAEFGEFLFVDDFEVRGIEQIHRTRGLGVPLIAIRTGLPPMPAGEDPQEFARFYHPDQTHAATVVLRMPVLAGPGLADPQRLLKQAEIHLIDPTLTRALHVGAQPVWLESELTTPLGYFLSKARLERLEFIGLVRTDSVAEKTGLYLLGPYQPGKIPVVMVHGLWSSPMTWTKMLNELMADPVVRERYQFWYFLYPTGNPIPYSAARLRESLQQARATFDPERDDPALDQMILVGHSMGGLLSKMMVQDSGDRLWASVATEPIDRLAAEEEDRQFLRDLYYYGPQPGIAHVVFIATPHRGSELTKYLVGRLTRAVISLPERLVDRHTRLVRANPKAFVPFFRLRPTSIDTLDPDSPVIQVVASTPIAPAVRYHSIVGWTKGETLAASSDSVVPYESSHIDGAESEVVVKAGHSACQMHPETIQEVRRILLHHLAETSGIRNNPIQLVDLEPDDAQPPLPPGDTFDDSELLPAR